MNIRKDDFKALINLARRAWSIVKEDTIEIYEKYLKPRKRRVQGKRINFWAGTLLVVVSSLSIYIILPLFAGMTSLVFEHASSKDVVTPSSQAIVSFIIISTALGSLLTWFIRTKASL